MSDRDLRAYVGRGQLEGTPIRELVAPRIDTLEPGAKLSQAAHLMARHRIGAVPIMEDERLIGLLTSTDVLVHCTSAFAALQDVAGG